MTKQLNTDFFFQPEDKDLSSCVFFTKMNFISTPQMNDLFG